MQGMLKGLWVEGHPALKRKLYHPMGSNLFNGRSLLVPRRMRFKNTRVPHKLVGQC